MVLKIITIFFVLLGCKAPKENSQDPQAPKPKENSQGPQVPKPKENLQDPQTPTKPKENSQGPQVPTKPKENSQGPQVPKDVEKDFSQLACFFNYFPFSINNNTIELNLHNISKMTYSKPKSKHNRLSIHMSFIFYDPADHNSFRIGGQDNQEEYRINTKKFPKKLLNRYYEESIAFKYLIFTPKGALESPNMNEETKKSIEKAFSETFFKEMKNISKRINFSINIKMPQIFTICVPFCLESLQLLDFSGVKSLIITCIDNDSLRSLRKCNFNKNCSVQSHIINLRNDYTSSDTLSFFNESNGKTIVIVREGNAVFEYVPTNPLSELPSAHMPVRHSMLPHPFRKERARGGAPT